jgi:hypothetical protein
MIPSNTPPTVAELPVAIAGQLNSLAQTVAADPFRIWGALQLLHRDMHIAVRTTLCSNGTVAKQINLLIEDRVRVVTCPIQATDSSNEAVCLANLGTSSMITLPSVSLLKSLGDMLLPLSMKE